MGITPQGLRTSAVPWLCSGQLKFCCFLFNCPSKARVYTINKLQGVSVDECSCYLPQLTTYSAHSQAQSAGWNCSSSFSLTYYSFFFLSSRYPITAKTSSNWRVCLLMLRTWITVNWKSHPLPDKHGELNRAVTGRWRSTVTVRATLFFTNQQFVCAYST